jgi:hypothetical protein
MSYQGVYDKINITKFFQAILFDNKRYHYLFFKYDKNPDDNVDCDFVITYKRLSFDHYKKFDVPKFKAVYPIIYLYRPHGKYTTQQFKEKLLIIMDELQLKLNLIQEETK